MNKILKKINSSVTIRSGIWYTIGNFMIKGINFITIPIFTRLLSTSDYGLVNTYMAWLAVVSVLIGLGIDGTISNAKYEFNDNLYSYMSATLSLPTISSIVILIIGNIYLYFINYNQMSALLFSIMIFQGFGLFIFNYLGSKYRLENEYKIYLRISLSYTLLNTILSIVFVLFLFKSNAYMGRILGGALITIIYGIIIYIIVIAKGKILFKKEYLKFGLSIGIPLMPHILSGIILSQFNRIMINSYVGSSAAGIYSFTYNIGMILNILWESMNSAWVPWFYEKMNSKSIDEIRDKSKYYILLFSIISVAAVLVSPEIIRFLSPPEYWVGVNLVLPIVLSGFFVFLYSLPVNVEFFYKKTKYISAGTVISAVVNIVLNIIFIPLFGYVAAAYITLITYILQFVFHWCISKYLLKADIFEFKYFLYSIIVVCGFSTLFMLLVNEIIIRYLIVLLVVSILMKNYKKLLKQWRNK